MTDQPETALTILPPAGALETLDMTIRDNFKRHAYTARGTKARETMRRIKSNTRVFSAWCAAHDVRAAVPVGADVVAAFIDDQAEVKCPGSVSCIVRTVGYLHRAARQDDPTKDAIVKQAVERMNRAKGTRQKQAHGLTYDIRNLMLKHAGERLIDKRNKALVALAYDALSRRSELTSFDIEDLQIGADGAGTLLLRKSKTDQAGAGHVIAVVPDTVALVMDWIKSAGITEGAIFRTVTRHGKTGRPMRDDTNTGRMVAAIFRQMAIAAGIDPAIAAKISGHSARIGAAQDMTAAGMTTAETATAGRWKDSRMVSRYTERLDAKRGATMKLAAMQGRI